jgi:hypothetical protein
MSKNKHMTNGPQFIKPAIGTVKSAFRLTMGLVDGKGKRVNLDNKTEAFRATRTPHFTAPVRVRSIELALIFRIFVVSNLPHQLRSRRLFRSRVRPRHCSLIYAISMLDPELDGIRPDRFERNDEL